MNKKNKKFAYQEAIESENVQGVDDILAAMNEMVDKEMDEMLISLSATRTWIAMIRYTRHRSSLVDGALRSIDPFKEPTQMARNQGIAMGLKDLFEYVDAMKVKMQEEAEAAQKIANEEQRKAVEEDKRKKQEEANRKANEVKK